MNTLKPLNYTLSRGEFCGTSQCFQSLKKIMCAICRGQRLTDTKAVVIRVGIRGKSKITEKQLEVGLNPGS